MEKRKSWLAHYPNGVKEKTVVDSNLVVMLKKSVERFGQNNALSFLGKKISYEHLDQISMRLAESLRCLGVREGDRVALVVPNCPQAVIAYYGILMAKAVVVPCNPIYTEKELEHQFKDAGVKSAIVLDQFYPKVKTVKQTINQNGILDTIIVTSVADYLPFPLSQLYATVYPMKLKKKIQETKDPKEAAVLQGDLDRLIKAAEEVKKDQKQIVFFTDLVKKSNSPISLDPASINPDDVAMIQYTGGTTGASKGAMLTHKSLMINVGQLTSWFYEAEPGKEKFLAALPLFHVFGMSIAQNACLSIGGEMLLVPNAKEIHEVIKTIVKGKPTIVPGVPKLFSAIIANYEMQDFSSVRYCVAGGASLPMAVKEEFERITGGKLVEGYGLTEASPTTHCNPLGGLCKTGSIGIPLPETLAKVVDDDGKELAVGEKGELWVKGSQVMKGYWNRVAETKEMITDDGWLKTGDMATMDEDGYFFIVDRKKNMILSDSGLNVYPREIEEALFAHLAVEDAAAIGIPTGKGSEEIKIFVVLKQGKTATAEELIEHCKQSLAPYKVPKKVEFRTQLPVTMIGKTLHRVLREEEIAKLKKQ